MEKLNAVEITPRRMVIFEEAAQMLLNKYMRKQMGISTYKETCSNNPLTFSNCGRYTYAHTYIEYIENVYGWNAVLKIRESGDYEEVFGKSKEDIYDEWVEYIREYYQ